MAFFDVVMAGFERKNKFFDQEKFHEKNFDFGSI